MKITRFCQGFLSPLRIVTGATLVIAVSASILLGGDQSRSGRNETRTRPAVKSISGREVNYYSRLKADSRTLVAMVHYLLEPEGVSPATASSGLVATNFTLPHLAAPRTNSTGFVPTV
jgi:hypothetical protein